MEDSTTVNDTSHQAILDDVGAHAPEQPETKRVTWSDPDRREEQIDTFLRWLPDVLRDAESIDWNNVPGPVMGYLINGVDLDAWWGIPVVLAAGITSGAGITAISQYSCIGCVLRLCKHLAATGVYQLAALQNRTTWQEFLSQLHSSPEPALVAAVNAYTAIAAMEADVVSMEDDSEAPWLPYVLPLLPQRHLRSFRLGHIVRSVAQRKRRAEVQVLLPLQPFLTNLAVARYQAAHKIHQQYLEACRRVEAGEASLPYQFVIRTTNPTIIDNHAETVADLRIALEPIELPATLWNRASWTIEHAEQYHYNTLWLAKTQAKSYAPESESYYLQFRCSSGRVLWFGDIISAGLLRGSHHHRYKHDPDLAALAARLGLPRGVATNNGELLNPGIGHARYLQENASPSDLLVHWESLYRGILYGAALAVIGLTSAARTTEIQQISVDRWVMRDVPEIRGGLKTGHNIRIYLQNLLPKGYYAEEERQFFLISHEAAALLMEIGEGLAPNPKDIPLAQNRYSNKAEHLANERYLFQWTTENGRARSSRPAHVLARADINTLIRFMFVGLELTVPHSGTTIRFTVHLLRHVLATHARHRAQIPPEAVAFLLHHRVRSSSSTNPSVQVGEATNYYSESPETDTLARLDDLQRAAFLVDDAIVIAPITEQDLNELDEDLRDTIEHWGTIGTTALGFCKAGTCIRREDRALCIGCPYLVVYYRMLANAQSWRSILLQEIEHLEQHGNSVEARQRKVKVKCLNGYIAAMETQVQILANGQDLPRHFAIAHDLAHPVEASDHAR